MEKKNITTLPDQFENRKKGQNKNL